uniref:Remorin C-terminal domain-containing protein n=1 Tax=Oryza brachyantha TaxID=4533 RepID=J3NEZ6_ORYBR
MQMGVMSPTKLRMKLLGSHGSSPQKIDEAKKSPARLDADDDGDDHPKNSLLAQELDEGLCFLFDSFSCTVEVRQWWWRCLIPAIGSSEYPKDRSDSSRSRSDASHGRAGHGGGGNGYDSGHDAGGGGGFEFYREERPPAAVVGGTFFRQVPSKWNDAEKWLAVQSSPRGCSNATAASSSSERELQIRTRREIAVLGMQMGKMSIASWASKQEELVARASPEKRPHPGDDGDGDGDAKRHEFEARAVAWQETQKCKLALRYQRKEVKIQEWESCQKAKFEAKMRHAEVQAEQMKARAKQKLSRRLSALSHKAEGKQARAEARRSRQAARLARQVDRIRDTGVAPPSSRLRRCCSWLFL